MIVTLGLSPLKTEAGVSQIILDASSQSSNSWNNVEGDVTVEEGKVIFPNESTKYTRYISKSAVKKDEDFEILATMSADMKLTKLPSGESFIWAFGLSGIESEQGDAGNIEVAFANNGGIKVGISVYGDDGTPEVIAAQNSCGFGLNQTVAVQVQIRTDGNIILTVGGRQVCSGVLPINGEGRVGFLQTGGCGAELNNLKLVHYQYDRPENTNVEEDFEKGGLDVSKLTAKMIGGTGGQNLEERDGGHVLMFHNTDIAYLGTLYKYSNFEMTFDVPYLQVKDSYNENGSLEAAAFKSLMVAFGSEQADWDGADWQKAADAVVFQNGQVYSNNYPEKYTNVLKKNPFAEDGRTFSVKVSVVDGTVTVAIKWLEEEAYDTVLTYSLNGSTPTGYVHIWSPRSANFAIDNFKITNLDTKPNLIEPEYKSGNLQITESTKPEEVKRVYADSKDTDNTWYLLIPTTVVVCGIARAVTSLAVRGKKKGKEMPKNEK